MMLSTASTQLPEIPGLPTSELQTTLFNFMARLGGNFKHPIPTSRDLSLEDSVKRKLFDLGLDDEGFKIIQPNHTLFCQYATMCCGYLDMNAQVFIGALTDLLTTIDDVLADSSLTKTFAQNFFTQQPKGHPLLECLARLLTEETSKIYGPYATTSIIVSVLEAISALALESSYPAGFPTSMDGFSIWVRQRTGYAIAYGMIAFPNSAVAEEEWLGHFLPIMPAFGEIICYVNDILSFYKECVNGEVNGLIFNLAKERHCSNLEALELACQHAYCADENIRQCLKNQPKLLDAYNFYLQGYLQWHFLVGRYMLEDVGIRC
ncbi:hypothetical protein NLG97_g4802 [Lecanicillium saksenae]|uniref:Uncharacterized protein n=1 Tax=Lecanicillium saksenae TaxID=468837 RepID=A0ACC1QU94_9HYPO|nr:hypothetical protein NLG97_g4802 [Lecanicillium saksenae]